MYLYHKMKKFTEELLKGKKFGMLTCLKFSHRNEKRQAYFFWKCDCGKEILHNASHIVYGQRFSCGCTKRWSKLWDKHKAWTGYKEICGTYWSSIKRNAKKRNLEMSISIEYAWNKFIEQNRMCALTGIPIYFQARKDLRNATASLDRIDSSKGYIEGNVQWVHKKINYMKQQFNQTEFIEWCKKVVNHNA